MKKFKILKPVSTDAGVYGGLKDFPYGNIISAEYIDSKQKGIIIKGDEFIKLGACGKCFNSETDYIWGSF